MNSLDFIEMKKKSASLGTAERQIKRLVQEGRVRRIIKDVELPSNVRVTEIGPDEAVEEKGIPRGVLHSNHSGNYL